MSCVNAAPTWIKTPARLYRLGILGDFGLEDIDRILDRTPRELSGGQRRRVSVAAAVAADPELLIIDEPTAGVDTPPWS
ncbi:ABC transporter ATP-binding protein [Corynebacterium diphtheriae]|nr:ABC transporter ATP-binding protein [Corynebacterium diphtheriae]CAB0667946.1 ABC transporter ATP-binding protein [Corynebacterium diphtheriae]CAB1010427.1 ABC transporter ATP-binding protein [Corynebacterium diphtheriae]